MTEKTLEEVDQFKYLGSTQTKDGKSIKEVKIRLELAHSAITRLAILWKNNAISFKLYMPLVLSMSILSQLVFGRYLVSGVITIPSTLC